MKDGNWIPQRDAIKELISIQINSPPKIFAAWWVISTLIDEKVRTYEMDREAMKKYRDTNLITFPTNCVINRETKISFFSEDSKAKPLFYFWLHTKFVPSSNRLELDKRSLDKLKDKELFDAEFRIILNFAEINPTELQAKLQINDRLDRGSTRNHVVNSLKRVKTITDPPPNPNNYPIGSLKRPPNEPPPLPPSPAKPAFTSIFLEEFIEKKKQSS